MREMTADAVTCTLACRKAGETAVPVHRHVGKSIETKLMPNVVFTCVIVIFLACRHWKKIKKIMSDKTRNSNEVTQF